MRIIISPAKKMRVQSDIMETMGTPVFLRDADRIREILKSFSIEELKNLYRANDTITGENYRRLQTMDLSGGLTPAVLAYVGLQYQSMAPDIFTAGQWDYINGHLRILSGFYGVLRALDGVVPYRLEMQAKLVIDGKKDLYDYWGRRIYEELIRDSDHVIINLASKEYSKAVEPYVTADSRMIQCVFGEEEDGRVKVKATQAKMARGEMVRFMADVRARSPEEVKAFNRLGYRYREELSGEEEYVFTTRRIGEKL